MNQKLIELTKEFLGEDGIAKFQKWYDEYSTVSPVYKEDNIIYPVHFREGVVIRNFMRRSIFCKGWKDEDFESNWPILVMAACDIKEKEIPKLEKGRFIYYEEKQNEWRFKLVTSNNQILVISESYTSKINCINGIEDVKRLVSLAEVNM